MSVIYQRSVPETLAIALRMSSRKMALLVLISWATASMVSVQRSTFSASKFGALVSTMNNHTFLDYEAKYLIYKNILFW
jgi:hypothetical protein